MTYTLIRACAALLPGAAIPAPDPIPLPAPVWLLKSLHDFTLGLHFGALHLLLGGLVLATVWNLVGHLRGHTSARASSDLVARKLPIVMTFVINLGVPPLLFAQVLYGQALYTSSILMAAWWFSAVFLIMAAYAALYRMSYLAERSAPFWPWSLVAIPLLALVGRLFSGNMTLMLRPEAWAAIYAADPHGTSLPKDPTTWPRFAVMMLASLAFGALGTSLWSLRTPRRPEAGYLRRQTALVAAIILPALLAAGLWAMGAQPVGVQSAVLGSALGRNLSWIWVACVVLAFVASLVQAWKPSAAVCVASAVPAVVATGVYVVVRDLVRDATLGPKGLEVWSSAVHSNWIVVGIFLASLVAGLALMAWIGWIVGHAKPKPPSETIEGGIAVEGKHV